MQNVQKGTETYELIPTQFFCNRRENYGNADLLLQMHVRELQKQRKFQEEILVLEVVYEVTNTDSPTSLPEVILLT